MNTVLGESSIANKTKKIILISSIIFAFLGFIFLIVNINNFTDDGNKGALYYIALDGKHWLKYDPVLESKGGYSVVYVSSFWEFPYVYIAIGCLAISALLLIFYFMTSKMYLLITNKHVCGRTYFGRKIDVPVDSISSVSSTLFKGVSITAASRKTSFLLIENSEKMRSLLYQLLTDKQNRTMKENISNVASPTSNADELKKYKELLDSGVISQEEFDSKKKQLLGM